MANRNFTQKMFTLRNYPVLLDCNFIVNNANASGITALKGPGIANVFMHTTTTPTTGSPNPEAGTAIVFLQDNYKRYLGNFSGFVSALSGSNLTTGLTVGRAYTITVLGASTLAQWQTAGLTRGITPALGVTFIAEATSIAGGGAVQAPVSAGIDSIELVNDPNATLNFQGSPAVGAGPYLIIRFLNAGAATAPANGSTCHLAFYLSNSSINSQGE